MAYKINENAIKISIRENTEESNIEGNLVTPTAAREFGIIDQRSGSATASTS